MVGSDKVRRSKLHLVDLAGSERVAKTNSQGSVLTEAKHINTSLFYLEMVIVALYEKATKGRTHIPYRNSMMTSVLRDSLGGNCKTIMIATINPESAHTEESLSTCKFAQRVSLIKNKALLNEETDPSIIIRRLKDELLNLREEISFLKVLWSIIERCTRTDFFFLVLNVSYVCAFLPCEWCRERQVKGMHFCRWSWRS